MTARRRRVIMCAYQCGPGEGSEAGAGWNFVRAAATHSDVWVITRHRFQPAIAAALEADPELAAHVHVTYFDLSPRLVRAKRSHRDVYWYYPLWQRGLRRIARSLHDEAHFDVAHHATFAADWQPVGLRELTEVPLVWGPVGGSTYQPIRLLRWLGWKGVVGELGRSALTRAARRVWADPVARQASLIVALNNDVAARFESADRVIVEPNIALPADLPARTPLGVRNARPRSRAVYAGRLVPWKGAGLAVRALAEPAAANWTLDIYGTGTDHDRLVRLATRLGIGDRVHFLGQVDRPEALAAIADADAMLFPSMHDSAPWVVGEASAIGCPIVCLDHGGPPLLAHDNVRLVPTSGSVVRELANALAGCAVRDGTPTNRWSQDRLPALTESWYLQAIQGAPRSQEVTA